MKNIRIIIFDLDGTLVDAYRAIISSFNYTMQKFGYPKQADPVIRRAVGRGDENLLKPFINPKDLRKALVVYRRHHSLSLVKESRLLPGARNLLVYLKKKGYKLAVASNRPTRYSWILVRHLKLKKYFDYVLCADKLKHGKPHPDILNRVMRRFSMRAEQALYVGDMHIDAETGRRAGVKTVIVTTGSSDKKEVKKEKPYLIIKSLADLFKIL
jgi:phosphoglycolate phosphatase